MNTFLCIRRLSSLLFILVLVTISGCGGSSSSVGDGSINEGFFVDRMVWLFKEMKDSNPKYLMWLKS